MTAIDAVDADLKDLGLPWGEGTPEKPYHFWVPEKLPVEVCRGDDPQDKVEFFENQTTNGETKKLNIRTGGNTEVKVHRQAKRQKWVFAGNTLRESSPPIIGHNPVIDKE